MASIKGNFPSGSTLGPVINWEEANVPGSAVSLIPCTSWCCIAHVILYFWQDGFLHDGN